MKDRILLFIIGVLVGAVISTGAFFIYMKAITTCDTNNNTQMQMPWGNPPSMQDGQSGQSGQPPEKPDGENGQPSEQPSDSNTQNSDQTNNS